MFESNYNKIEIEGDSYEKEYCEKKFSKKYEKEDSKTEEK